ncbi:hypothetical protein RJ55_07289 [Drechmeria coniospora]|nr:hypothetical protein RJ55_07289 [Drechmeria coniospora]
MNFEPDLSAWYQNENGDAESGNEDVVRTRQGASRTRDDTDQTGGTPFGNFPSGDHLFGTGVRCTTELCRFDNVLQHADEQYSRTPDDGKATAAFGGQRWRFRHVRRMSRDDAFFA